ncbi:hypothetical protein [Nocardia asteroides]|uniref:hypothetical protein n=1 Tax=Nocardia asteroides TaxID=1824 RepID=UPI001E6153D8|nr:hypothetical protein [Nocardia asteroides]UGT57848.1 hypothetical protein LTT85_13845 [Nocardia asteroides]
MTDRLTVVDEIFLRTHREMGTPIALQGLWRTDDAVEPALLQSIHGRLRVGALGRRVVDARVPGARRRWQPTTAAHPLDLGDPLTESAILPWADSLGTGLDPEFGPGWRLSSAPLTEGGTVVALTCSHVLADARGLIHAVATALAELMNHAGDPRIETTPSPTGAVHRPTSDWADARAQWTTILGGTARALRQGLPRPPATHTPAPSSGRAVHSTLLTFDVADWDTTAAAAGGTANSLFIHLVANILWANGFPAPTIAASLPVDTRDEPRVDNDLAVTEIAIARTDTPASIRDKARDAYQRRMSSPAGLPEEILQVLPDRWAYALSKGAGERDILCSNIGTLPDALRTVGTHRCDRVAARAIHPGLTAFPRTQLSGYLSRLGDTYTLALVSLSRHPETLGHAIDHACATTGVQPAHW